MKGPQPCSPTTPSPSGTGRPSSTPRRISRPMRAARRRAGSSPAARASGSRIATGSRLLDAFAGLYCVNVGYGRREISDAIAAQARELAYYHAYVGHGTEASITLAKMILDRAPEGMSKVYFGLGGSDANETNVKLVWYYNNILGRPAEEEDHLALARLSRLGADDRLADRARSSSTTSSTCRWPQVLHTEAPYYFRRTDLAQSRGRVRRPLRRRTGGADRARGRRHHRRLHRRAGARHRRAGAAARGLLGGDPADPRASTTSC